VSQNPLAPDWLVEPSDPNALAPAVWSRTARRTDDGELELGGIRASELAKRFGTPVYVVDEADARGRADEILAAFSAEFARVGTSVSVYYAGKAFLCTEVARWMTGAGLNIDVASGGELAVALAAGVNPARLGMHGNNKSHGEIDRAVGVGIGTIVLDIESEIGLVAAAAARHGARQRVRLRVNSGVHASTHEYLATAREDQKFGVPLADVARLVALVRAEPSLEFVGLHSHIGSQIFDTAGFGEAARRLLRVTADLLEGGDVPELNLGGGFGIAYTSADDAPDIAEIARSMADIVAAEAAALGVPLPRIAIEPGRSIIGPSTTTLYTVGVTKPVAVTLGDEGTAERLYVSVDGGMSDNIRTALYGANYSARVVSRSSAADAALVRVAGKHCESGDIVVDAEYLPGDVRSGDLLGVPATGAYGWALSSNYNYLTRPPVVAVKDGEARLIVRGETEDDLLARDMGVQR
jgi:diaminopimelate decarboxylase